MRTNQADDLMIREGFTKKEGREVPEGGEGLESGLELHWFRIIYGREESWSLPWILSDLPPSRHGHSVSLSSSMSPFSAPQHTHALSWALPLRMTPESSWRLQNRSPSVLQGADSHLQVSGLDSREQRDILRSAEIYKGKQHERVPRSEGWTTGAPFNELGKKERGNSANVSRYKECSTRRKTARRWDIEAFITWPHFLSNNTVT